MFFSCQDGKTPTELREKDKWNLGTRWTGLQKCGISSSHVLVSFARKLFRVLVSSAFNICRLCPVNTYGSIFEKWKCSTKGCDTIALIQTPGSDAIGAAQYKNIHKARMSTWPNGLPVFRIVLDIQLESVRKKLGSYTMVISSVPVSTQNQYLWLWRRTD